MTTVECIIADLHAQYEDCDEGALADYIPELTRANPEWFGISVYTVDGHGYDVGDCADEFTIQSISKAFIYGMVLDDHGFEAVSKKIGVEPSGEAFNSISLDPASGRPLNPMINAGAIAVTGLVEGPDQASRFKRIRDKLSAYAGRPLGFDESVYRSESSTGFRNRAIANLLRNFDIIGDPVEETTEVYFRQCSVLVNCRDLAVMGATLANAGVNPLTDERVLETENVDRVLSVMSTCGMYDYSGEWIFRVGLPAKSGVGGGIVGVLPGQLGFSVFSPRLDEKGNSVRGLRVFSELSKRFNLHLFNVPTISGQSIRRTYHLGEVDSKRQRPLAQQETIQEHGGMVRVIEMQGDLFFSSMERLLRTAANHMEEARTFVLDLRRVGFADRSMSGILHSLASNLSENGRDLSVIDPNRLFDRESFQAEATNVRFSDDLETALEVCEEDIVRAYLAPPLITGLVPFYEFEIFDSLSSTDLSIVESFLEMASYKAGEKIVEQDSDPDFLYLLAKGSVKVEVWTGGNNGDRAVQRLAAFCPGVAFGDLAIIDGSRRSTDVTSEEPSTCYLLPVESFREIERDHPAIYAKLLRNLLRMNVNRLRRSNREISSLKR